LDKTKTKIQEWCSNLSLPSDLSFLHLTYRRAYLPFHQNFQKATLHLLQKPKTISPQTQFQQLMSQQFSHYLQIFTDGSKSDFGVGAALCIPYLPRHYSFSIPSFRSIFHAEQVEIYQTILFIKENFTVGYLLIISDSLSALQ